VAARWWDTLPIIGVGNEHPIAANAFADLDAYVMIAVDRLSGMLDQVRKQMIHLRYIGIKCERLWQCFPVYFQVLLCFVR
jgi:hypothetical protein